MAVQSYHSKGHVEPKRKGAAKARVCELEAEKAVLASSVEALGRERAALGQQLAKALNGHELEEELKLANERAARAGDLERQVSEFEF